ncbi:hypothetical protein KDH_00770 [Dictyobacter sp. S3.2.2.5]|uniref:RDD domain-containing protein n=1 Tax=Dictyobacter halimunensis TaxID=3026934 RepID=A0ABQ6FGX7_9CHLR|nr:hypothetical protein KDH_00770 [Dictyobacter sp. S3.2.2.5]
MFAFLLHGFPLFARVMQRLFQIVQVIGLATGGRLGVCVIDRLGIQTTRQIILRRIMALPTVPVGQVTQIGISMIFVSVRSQVWHHRRSLFIYLQRIEKGPTAVSKVTDEARKRGEIIAR